jgi:integrase
MIIFKKVAFYNEVLGMTSYDLLDLRTGKSVDFYSHYINKVIRDQVAARKKVQNTIDAIALDLKVFFEYVFNAQEIFFEKKLSIESTLLSEIILSYPDYLSFAHTSLPIIAKETAEVTNRSKVEKKSVNRMLSTVNGFTTASANHYEMLKVAKENNYIDIDIPPENIHDALLERKELSISERNALKEKSVMSQVVRGGARYSSTKLFKSSSSSGGTLSDYKHFPVEYIIQLLDTAPTYRDRALWALCAGAGSRISEASQLLVPDVNIITEEVHVFSYQDRIECFEGLEYKQLKSLAFKGRTTTDTFFIEPFKSIFFEAITNYLKYERPKNLKHNYLFVTLSNNYKGKPLFSAARSSLGGPIKKVQEKIKCPKKNKEGSFYTLHSLRHFYGYWLINFHITPAGVHFTEKEVQNYMGHAKISSTQKYAIVDRIIAKEKMKLANSLLENKNNIYILTDHKNKIIKSLKYGH